MRLIHAAHSQVGTIREQNEDAWLAVPGEQLFIVADGMGGHASGEIASWTAVRAIETFFAGGAPGGFKPHVDTSLDRHASRLLDAIRFAHEQVRRKAAADPLYRGMGTTIVCVLLAGGLAYIAHVGDSRCYWFNRRVLTRLTRDHSEAALLSLQFGLPEEHKDIVGRRHVLLRCLGDEEEDEIEIDLAVLPPERYDVFLLCSDGLHSVLSDKDIESAVASGLDPEQLCQSLAACADSKGSPDDVTVLALKVEER